MLSGCCGGSPGCWLAGGKYDGTLLRGKPRPSTDITPSDSSSVPRGNDS
jgi:hypothetical protein